MEVPLCLKLGGHKNQFDNIERLEQSVKSILIYMNILDSEYKYSNILDSKYKFSETDFDHSKVGFRRFLILWSKKWGTLRQKETKRKKEREKREKQEKKRENKLTKLRRHASREQYTSQKYT